MVTDETALPVARRAVERELVAIDEAASRFRDDSELTRLNARAGQWVEIGPLLFEAIDVALRAAALTDGAVDPTIGQALILTGYDRDFAQVSPIEVPIRARRVPGWRKLELDHRGRRVRVPIGVSIDLGATAKALAADRAAEAAAAAAPDAGILVNLGGDIAIAGRSPRTGWPVFVTDDHRAPQDAHGQHVTLRSGGLATSSTTVRRWARGAHHIIDPATGAPTRECWRTVSVCAASCVDANIASTAAIVAGEPAAAWLQERRLPARLVGPTGAVRNVAGWPGEAFA